MAQNQTGGDMTALMNMMGLGAGAAGIGGGLYNIFGKGPNFSGTANQYLNQIPGAMQPYYQPYMTAGQNALGQLMGQYGSLTGNTGDIYNKLAGGYQQSPGYQSAMQEAMRSVGNQAAAGGMAGSPAAQVSAAEYGGKLAQQDFGDYMNRMMGLYNTGLQGLSGINQMGYGANTSFGNLQGDILGQQAQYAVLDKAMRNQQRGQGWGQLAGGLGALGGFMLGGPPGAMMGYGVGKTVAGG